jgi:hypothetical protein
MRHFSDEYLIISKIDLFLEKEDCPEEISIRYISPTNKIDKPKYDKRKQSIPQKDSNKGFRNK